LYARPDDVRSWINLLDRVREDAELRSSLRERGLRQAAKFTWAEAARKTVEVYQAAASNNMS
jgi:alpha-1,3-rhamnosyl/mannosyltransferase